MKRLKKGNKKGLQLRKNKKFFGSFVGIFALIIIINATLAWSSYTEWVKNHTQSNPEEIAVSVTEKFIQGSVLTFAEDNQDGTEKSVRVKNISERDAIVRVRFRESILPFELDMTDGEGQGNANLKTYKRTSEALIDVSNSNTWNVGNLFESGLTDGSDKLYYKAISPIEKDVLYKGEAYRASSSYPDALKYFEWTFNPALKSAPDTGISTPYWVFDGEYFYYSQVLEGGETTAIDLLQSVILANVNIPNIYKNALYNIQVEAEGVNPTKAGLETWTTDSDYFDMYDEDPLFNREFK